MKQTLWLWPVVIAVLSSVALAAGLISDGAGDIIAWVGLAIPVWISVWFGYLKRAYPLQVTIE